MIRDLCDNSMIAYKAGTQQTVNLVPDTIRLAMKREKRRSPQSYSSTAIRGFTTLPRSIQSDQSIWYNAVHVKTGGLLGQCHGEKLLLHSQDGVYCRRKPVSFDEAKRMINGYIFFCNHERIQLKTGLAPLERRQSA